MSQSKNMNYIEALKGISILLITIMHCDASSLPGIPGIICSNTGAIGVSFFMIISGLLAFISLEHASNTSIWKWYLKKYMRLFPMYALAILVTLCTNTYSSYWLGNEGHVSFFNVLSHLVFAHGLFPHYVNSILSVEWYLGALALFYLISPLLFKLISSLERAIVLVTASIVAVPVINHLVYSLMPVSSDPVIYDAYKNTFSPIRLFPVYALGILLYYATKNIQTGKALDKRLASYALLIFATYMTIGQAISGEALFHVSHNTMFGLWGGLIILGLSICDNYLLNNPLFRLLGKYSYGMYLFQFIVINLYNRYFNNNSFIIRFLVATISLFTISVLLTRSVDTPIQNRLGKLLKK